VGKFPTLIGQIAELFRIKGLIFLWEIFPRTDMRPAQIGVPHVADRLKNAVNPVILTDTLNQNMKGGYVRPNI
jgi:hypothetical protein